LVGRSVVSLCTAQQLAQYGLSLSDQGAKTVFTGYNSDQAGMLSDLQCWKTDQKECDITWSSRIVYLCTRGGWAAEAREYIAGSLNVRKAILEARLKEAPKQCSSPTACKPSDIANPIFNCHGDTFDDDMYWIQYPQKILDEVFDPTTTPRVGDIAMYRQCTQCVGIVCGSCKHFWESRADYCERVWTKREGELVHSATLYPDVDTAFGKRGYEPRKTLFPVGPGKGTAWDDPAACVKYFRRK
jgi:hypothetical protein